MVKLSETSDAIDWLRQFSPRDQLLASALLDEIVLISRNEFSDRLQTLICGIGQSINGPVGLYVERELKKWHGTPNRLFKEHLGKPRRAEGNGPKVICPTLGYDQDVGSEGIISQLASELRRKDRKKYHVNPGPKQIRDRKIRAFILVSDFIGSGKRAEDYLTAAWRLASIKSWASLKLLSFHVVAYSGTQKGIKRLSNHKSKPNVREVLSCPTIDNVFEMQRATEIEHLCRTYDPDKKHDYEALGFDGTGALLVFAHGAPNNLPKILHKKGRNWHPLFPGRTTGIFRSLFSDRTDDYHIVNRLSKLKESGIIKSGWLSRKTNDAKSLMLLMIALKASPRFDDVLSRKTGLTIPEIGAFIDQLKNWGWINDNRRLTNEGQKQVRHARKTENEKNLSPQTPFVHYYPESLRMPSDASS